MRVLVLLSLFLWASGGLALPETLEETGFSEARTIAFTPQYPLWSDGTAKRRWLYLPAGTAIDKSRPDAWEFPPGTKAWKAFSLEGRKIETRLIERLADGSWRYSSYVWNAEGTKAILAPPQGEVVNGYAIPSRADCLACHEGAPVPILGYSAVQLEARIDPGLGYLHGNCGHCHNDSGPLANVDLSLAQRSSDPQRSAARTQASVSARGPELLARKMRSPNPLTRMPPLGGTRIDESGIALVERWMRHFSNPPEPSP